MADITVGSPAGKWIMTAAILASSMAFIDGTALNVVLPSLQQSLHATGTDLFWILNAYNVMLAAFILPGGSLGDRLGRKKVFMLGIFIFIAGSVSCGFAPSVNVLVACRLLQGFGGAFMIPGSLSVISSSFSDNERGKAIGTWSAFTTMVTIGGPILGGALADSGLWRYIFFINVPIGIISLLVLAFKVKESRNKTSGSAIDYAGAITIVAGLALMTFGFLRIPAAGLTSLEVIFSIAGGLALLAVFFFIEKKSKHAMMPLQLFTNKAFSGANLLSFFLYAGLGGGILFLTLNMVQVQGYSQLQAGLTLLPFTILMIALARVSGAFTDRHGPRLLLIAGPATAGLGLVLLSFVKQTTGAGQYWSTFFPGILIFGLGMSCSVAPLTTTVMGSLPNRYSGTASGINNAVTRIAGVFANAIMGALAILFFSTCLHSKMDMLSISTNAKQAIAAQSINLGDAKVPDIISSESKSAVKELYRQSFIYSYGNIMKICGALGFLASIMAFIFIKNEEVKVKESNG